MSVPVLSNLLNEFSKCDKMRGVAAELAVDFAGSLVVFCFVV